MYRLAAKTMSLFIMADASSIFSPSFGSPMIRAAFLTSRHVSSNRWIHRTIIPEKEIYCYRYLYILICWLLARVLSESHLLARNYVKVKQPIRCFFCLLKNFRTTSKDGNQLWRFLRVNRGVGRIDHFKGEVKEGGSNSGVLLEYGSELKNPC